MNFKPETVREALLVILDRPEEAERQLARIDDGPAPFSLSSPFVVSSEHQLLDTLTLVFRGRGSPRGGDVFEFFMNENLPVRPVVIRVPEGRQVEWVQVGAVKGTLRELWRHGAGVPTVSRGQVFAVCLQGDAVGAKEGDSLEVVAVRSQ